MFESIIFKNITPLLSSQYVLTSNICFQKFILLLLLVDVIHPIFSKVFDNVNHIILYLYINYIVLVIVTHNYLEFHTTYKTKNKL